MSARAAMGAIGLCDVIVDGKRFMYISNPARAYLVRFGATPKPVVNH